MTHVNRIGIEIEGLWYQTRIPSNPLKDVSVQFTPGELQIGPDQFISNHFIGETASMPLVWENVKPWIDKNYPDKVNTTCGLHVHISVKSDSDYIRLMDPEFERFFLIRMEEFGKSMKYPQDHPFWCRLKGSNPFCAKDHKPEEQVIRTDKRGPRYAQLNYCYGLHGTLECRLFHGTSNPDEILACVKSFVDCVEEFLERPEVKNKEFDKTYEIWNSELESKKQEPEESHSLFDDLLDFDDAPDEIAAEEPA